MPAGLQVWNASGVLTVDTSQSFPVLIGEITLPAGHTAGSQAVPEFTGSDRTPVAFGVVISPPGSWKFPPIVEVTSTGVTWRGAQASNISSKIVWGFV